MDNFVSVEEIILKCEAIIGNIKKNGLYRYDPVDFRSMEFISRQGFANSLLRKGVLALELFAPQVIRKIFEIEKSLHSTTYYHLGMACLESEKTGININLSRTSSQICNDFISEYVLKEGENVYWQYPYSNDFYYSPENEPTIFTMPMHGLARLNTLLLLTGIHNNNQAFIEIAVNSIETTLKQHTLTEYMDGAMSISYYCNSDDVTLNVCSEFACWLSLVPKNMQTQQMVDIINGIVKLMINEQQDDGSWLYFGSMHHEKWGGKRTVDCHHTATNLTTLLTILENSDVLNPEVKDKLIAACDLGINFFINNFFDQNGRGIVVIGMKRPACSVQYSEAVFSFCKYMQSTHCKNIELKRQVSDLLPKIIQRLCDLVNKDGTVPSGIYFGKYYNLQSIRWGSGPVLQAIITYIAYITTIHNYHITNVKASK